MNILIVDDDLLIRKWLSMLLKQSTEHQVTLFEATDGIEALEICEQEEIHLVLTDIKMPRMDGLELIRILEKEKPEIHKAVLSSYDDFDYVKTMLKSGALDYILKAELKFEDIKELLHKSTSYEKSKQLITVDTQKMRTDNGIFHDFMKSEMDALTFFEKIHLPAKTDAIHVNVFKISALKKETQDSGQIIKTCNDVLNRQCLQGICVAFSETIYTLFYTLNTISQNTDKEVCSKTLAIVDKNLQKHHGEGLLNSATFSFTHTTDLKQTLQNAYARIDTTQKQYSPAIATAIAFIHENYANRIGLEDISLQVYLNKCYLSQIFKKEVGIAFNEYLEDVRISKAKQLLLTTSLSISQIAEECGFSNQNYFAKVFKQSTGFSALKFKQY